MVDVEVVPETASVDHPNQIAIEIFARLPLGVGHYRMLDFDDDPGRRLDIRSVDLAVGRDVRNFPAGLGKEIFHARCHSVSFSHHGSQLRRPACAQWCRMRGPHLAIIAAPQVG